MEPLIILVGVAAVPIAAVTYVWLRRRPPWRDLPGEMRKTRTRPVAELREGEVARVVGVVACAEPVPAPLTGRPCAYWQVLVEEKKRKNNIGYWDPIVDAHGGPDFLVVDATGAARVDTRVVTPELDRDRRFVSGILKEPPPELKAFLASRGHETTGLVFNKTLRYYEGVVEVGEEVAVVGKVTMEDVPDEASKGESYRDAGRKRPALRGPVLLSDEPAATKP